MSFGTFVMYLMGAILVLSVGWAVLVTVLRLFGAGTMAAVDGIKQGRAARAASKW